MKTEAKTKIMKREKRVKTVPTQEQIDKMVSEYLKNAGKHLFIKKDYYDKGFKKDRYFKVIPAALDGKMHFISITVSPTRVDVSIRDTSWVKTKNDLGMFKDVVFPGHYKHKSVKSYVGKNRVKLKQVFYGIEKLVKDNPSITKDELRNEIKSRVDTYQKWLEITE